MHLIEPLEARIAPASFFLYTDRDGDLVKVTSSKGDLNVDATITIALNQLRELDLTAPVFQGANISVSVKQAGNGDGLAHVGYIKANGRDLGTVIITGDLGQIDAGDSNEATAAVGALQVQSMGRVGTASQGGTGSLSSVLKGALGRLTIVGDLQDASISAVSVADPAFGKIGSVTIGGSILGGTISTSGNLGPVKIGRDLRAGDAAGGYLYSEGKMASVSIGGSLTGGTVAGSGSVLSLGDLGPVKVAGDVVGGSGPNAGFIFSNGKLAGVTIGGTLRGGSGDLTYQGQISSIGDMGPVNVRRNLQGNTGDYSGTIHSAGKLASVTVGGSLIGGSGTLTEDGNGYLVGRDTAGIRALGAVGPVFIAGDMLGGTTNSSDFSSAFVRAPSLASVTVGGSLIAIRGYLGAYILGEHLGPVKIGGDLRQGDAQGNSYLGHAGAIHGRHLTSILIGGSIYAGHSSFDYPVIEASDDLGPIVVKGSILGNAGSAVLIRARGQAAPAATTDLALASLTVGGNVEFTRIKLGDDFAGRGQNADAQLGAVKVAGDWVASSIFAGVDLGADGLPGTGDDRKLAGNYGAGPVKDGALQSRIASVVIGGQVLGTTYTVADRYGFVAEQTGSFRAAGFIARLTAGRDAAITLPRFTSDVSLREL